MLRYASHHNYEKKAVRKSHDKTKSNKRKSKKDLPTTSTEIEDINSKPLKSSKHNKKYEEYDEDDFTYTEKDVNQNVPKTWKDSWKKPLNQDIDMDEYDSSNDKIRTSKISKRQNNRKNAFIADMITSEWIINTKK